MKIEYIGRKANIEKINRVAMLTPTWNTTIGGTAKVANNLVSGIKCLYPICKVHVITSEGIGNESCSVSFMGGNIFSKIYKTVKTLKKFSPEAIHCHGRIHYILISYIYKILINKNVILICSFYTQPSHKTYLSTTIDGREVNKYERLRKLISIYLLNRTDKIVANSNSLAENIKKDMDAKILSSIKVIPSGVEKFHINDGEVQEYIKRYSLQNAYPVFSTVGVLQWDWKVAGMLILLKAFRRVIEEWSSSRLILVGDGQFRYIVEEEIERLRLQNHVIMTGNISNTFIPLAVSDIYCHMALNESCSVSILEAMISGKPIIAASAGGNSDLIKDGETGLLVEPEVEKLWCAMLKLSNNRELAVKLGRAATIVAEEKYNWAVIAKRYLLLYLDKI